MDPKQYSVMLLNDETTSFDQAFQVIMHVFGHTPDAAAELVNKIHDEGQAIAGEYILEIAESKISEVEQIAALNDMEFRATIDYGDELDDALEQLKSDIQDKLTDDPSEE